MNSSEPVSFNVGHTVKIDINPIIEETIELARKSRLAGHTKLDSVRSIYPLIAHLPRESIWYIMSSGVNLSSRGAVTYYYKVRREFLTQSPRIPSQ